MIYPPQASLFKEKLLVFFSSTRKTGWGKKEVIAQIKDCYIEFLEDLCDNKEVIKLTGEMLPTGREKWQEK